MDVNVVLQFVVLVAVAVVGFMLNTARESIAAAAKASAEQGVKIAINNINWPHELAHELEKIRSVERQTIRFTNYASLWSKLRPLAIYDTDLIDLKTTTALSNDLSNWYFSEHGGLLLTYHVRYFYFALQDLLRGLDGATGWQAQRTLADPKAIFKAVLKKCELTNALTAFEDLEAIQSSDWPGVFAERTQSPNGKGLAKLWHDDIERLPERWLELKPIERFAVLQQVGSVLRTALVNDVESRLR